MPETPLFPEGITLTQEGLQDVPRSVLIQIILALAEEKSEFRKRIEHLEARLNKDSSNSDRPPSSDPPFKKKKSGKKKKDTDRRKLTHPGHRQEMLPPKETRVILPEICTCGKMQKATVPKEHRTGYGPRLSAMIAEMAGTGGRQPLNDSNLLRFGAWVPYQPQRHPEDHRSGLGRDPTPL